MFIRSGFESSECHGISMSRPFAEQKYVFGHHRGLRRREERHCLREEKRQRKRAHHNAQPAPTHASERQSRHLHAEDKRQWEHERKAVPLPA